RKRRGGRASAVSHHGRRGRGHAASEQAELRYAARLRADHAGGAPYHHPGGQAGHAGQFRQGAGRACQGQAGNDSIRLDRLGQRDPSRARALSVRRQREISARALSRRAASRDPSRDPGWRRPHTGAGRLNRVGAAPAERTPMLADVSTLAEQGFPDTVADNWYGLLAPAKTPPAVVAKLHDAVVAVLDAPDIR